VVATPNPKPHPIVRLTARREATLVARADRIPAELLRRRRQAVEKESADQHQVVQHRSSPQA
jgi:hypothetical protein